MAGANRKPHAFFGGVAELSGVKGMSPSSTYKPGKHRFVTSGSKEIKFSFGRGNMVIHSLV